MSYRASCRTMLSSIFTFFLFKWDRRRIVFYIFLGLFQFSLIVSNDFEQNISLSSILFFRWDSTWIVIYIYFRVYSILISLSSIQHCPSPTPSPTTPVLNGSGSPHEETGRHILIFNEIIQKYLNSRILMTRKSRMNGSDVKYWTNHTSSKQNVSRFWPQKAAFDHWFFEKRTVNYGLQLIAKWQIKRSS